MFAISCGGFGVGGRIVGGFVFPWDRRSPGGTALLLAGGVGVGVLLQPAPGSLLTSSSDGRFLQCRALQSMHSLLAFLQAQLALWAAEHVPHTLQSQQRSGVAGGSTCCRGRLRGRGFAVASSSTRERERLLLLLLSRGGFGGSRAKFGFGSDSPVGERRCLHISKLKQCSYFEDDRCRR